MKNLGKSIMTKSANKIISHGLAFLNGGLITFLVLFANFKDGREIRSVFMNQNNQFENIVQLQDLNQKIEDTGTEWNRSSRQSIKCFLIPKDENFELIFLETDYFGKIPPEYVSKMTDFVQREIFKIGAPAPQVIH